jgi:protein tyrosine phosphatase (PTP) superfamily phosphohydrolase (DUF442 family)
MKQRWRQWTLAILMIVGLVAIPFAYYRWQYEHSKRLRVVVDGKVYRSGQLTADGLDDAIDRFGFRTIINFQDELPDPELKPGLTESEFCRRRGIRYVFLPPDLRDHWLANNWQPDATTQFLAIMDDPASYPVLLHCRAGLHRTGILTAVYRMEYQGWSLLQAVHELEDNGFGRDPCSVRNDYILEYLLNFHPRRSRRAVSQLPHQEPRHDTD